MERTAKNLRKRAKGNTPLEKRLDVLLPLIERYKHVEIEYFVI